MIVDDLKTVQNLSVVLMLLSRIKPKQFYKLLPERRTQGWIKWRCADLLAHIKPR